jgi:hypothetical protein
VYQQQQIGAKKQTSSKEGDSASAAPCSRIDIGAPREEEVLGSQRGEWLTANVAGRGLQHNTTRLPNVCASVRSAHFFVAAIRTFWEARRDAALRTADCDGALGATLVFVI